MVAIAYFVVALDYCIDGAFASLATVRVHEGGINGVNSASIPTLAFFVVASDIARLKAGACVASIAVDPRETDSVLLAVGSSAMARFVLTLNGSTLHAIASVAIILVECPDLHHGIGHWISAAGIAGARHLAS